jgi:hypothetical protein
MRGFRGLNIKNDWLKGLEGIIRDRKWGESRGDNDLEQT